MNIITHRIMSKTKLLVEYYFKLGRYGWRIKDNVWYVVKIIIH